MACCIKWNQWTATPGPDGGTVLEEELFNRTQRSCLSSVSSDEQEDKELARIVEYAGCSLNQLEHENQLLQQQLNERLAVSQLTAVSEAKLECLTGSNAGINRVSIQSNHYHHLMPNTAKSYFGFENWDDLKHFVELMFGLKHEEPTLQLLNK